MSDLAIKIVDVSKEYRLGMIGGGTLRGDLESWWARKRGKEDPNTYVNAAQHAPGERFKALKDINLEVPKGQRLGIIGHNGAGKSTLLKLITRVTLPTTGCIGYNGRIASMLEVGTGFNSELSGRENIYLNGAILGMTREEIDSKVDSIIEFAEIEQFIDTPVKRYSSGMYVKLAFAVAAHLDGEIMIMDEVLAVGDVNFQKKCLKKMRSAAADDGRTVLYVSHNMNTIRQLCERCIVIDEGSIIFDGDVEEAIAVYIGNRENERSNDIVFTEKQHNQRLNQEFVFDRMRLCHEVTEPYYCNDSFDIELFGTANTDIDEMYIRLEISSASGEPAGVMLCKENITAKASQKVRMNLRLSLDGLAPGKYLFTLFAHRLSSRGGLISIDQIQDAFDLSINRRPDSFLRVWAAHKWGHTRFKDLQMCEIERS